MASSSKGHYDLAAAALLCRWTTTRSRGDARTEHGFSPPQGKILPSAATGIKVRWSSTHSSARMGAPAATLPTTGTRSGRGSSSLGTGWAGALPR